MFVGGEEHHLTRRSKIYQGITVWLRTDDWSGRTTGGQLDNWRTTKPWHRFTSSVHFWSNTLILWEVWKALGKHSVKSKNTDEFKLPAQMLSAFQEHWSCAKGQLTYIYANYMFIWDCVYFNKDFSTSKFHIHQGLWSETRYLV